MAEITYGLIIYQKPNRVYNFTLNREQKTSQEVTTFSEELVTLSKNNKIIANKQKIAEGHKEVVREIARYVVASVNSGDPLGLEGKLENIFS